MFCKCSHCMIYNGMSVWKYTPQRCVFHLGKSQKSNGAKSEAGQDYREDGEESQSAKCHIHCGAIHV